MNMLLTAALIVTAALASFAPPASAVAIGEQVASGEMSQAALEQLIAGTGISVEEAAQMTVAEVAALKWKDD